MAPRSESFVRALCRDPGPASSERLRMFLSAFEPFISGSSTSSFEPEDNHDVKAFVENFAMDILIRVHGEEEGTDLARAFRPAIYRAASRNPLDAESSSASALAAKICVYAAMYDSFCKFDGGLVNTYGEGGDGDAALQLPEWIYGYRIVLRNAIFEGLKIRTEKKARAAFQDMLGGEEGNEVGYDQWCDYLERKEVDSNTQMGVLFGGTEQSENSDEQVAPRKSSSDAERNAVASLVVAIESEEGNAISSMTAFGVSTSGSMVGESALERQSKTVPLDAFSEDVAALDEEPEPEKNNDVLQCEVETSTKENEAREQLSSAKMDLQVPEGTAASELELLRKERDTFKDELVKLNEEVSATKDRHRDQVIALEGRLEEEDTSHKNEISKLLATMKSERSAATVEAEQQQKRLNEELASSEQRHQREVAELKMDFQERESIYEEEKHSAEMALKTAERNAADALEVIRLQLETSIEERDANSAEIIRLNKQISASKQEHQVQVADLNERLREMETAHAEELSKLAESEQVERVTAAQEVEQQWREKEMLHKQELGALKDALQSSERSAATKMEAVRAQLEAKAHENDAAVETLGRCQNELSKIKSEHQLQVIALEEQLEARKQDISRLTVTLQAERDAVTQDINQQQTTHNEAEALAAGQHQAEIAGLKRQLQESEDSRMKEVHKAEEALRAYERKASEDMDHLRKTLEASTQECKSTAEELKQMRAESVASTNNHQVQVAMLEARLKRSEQQRRDEICELTATLKAERDAATEDIERAETSKSEALATANMCHQAEIAKLNKEHQESLGGGVTSTAHQSRSLVFDKAIVHKQWTRRIIGAVLTLAALVLLFLAFWECANCYSRTAQVNDVKLEECRVQSTSLAEERNVFRSRSEELKMELTTMRKGRDEQIREAEKQMTKQASKIGEWIKENTVLSEERDALRLRSEQLKKELEMARKDSDERVREMEESMAKQVSEMKSRIKESATLAKERDTLISRSEKLKKELVVTQKGNDERVRDLEESMAKQVSEMDRQIKEKVTLSKERDAFRSRSEQLEKKLERVQKNGDMRVREVEESMRKKISEMDERIKVSVGTIGALRTDLDATRGELDGVMAAKAQSEKGKDQQIAELWSEFEASRADLIKQLEESHSKAELLESTLKDRNSDVIILRTELEEARADFAKESESTSLSAKVTMAASGVSSRMEKQNTTSCFSSGMCASTMSKDRVKLGASYFGAKLGANKDLLSSSARETNGNQTKAYDKMHSKLLQTPSHPMDRTSKSGVALLRDNIVPMAVGAGVALLLPFLWSTLGSLVAPALAGLPLWARSLFGRAAKQTTQVSAPSSVAHTLLGPFLWTAMGHLGITGLFVRTAGIAHFIRAILKW